MAVYKVFYRGFYIIEADSIDEALETERDDAKYEEWENEDAYELVALNAKGVGLLLNGMIVVRGVNIVLNAMALVKLKFLLLVVIEFEV